MFAIIYGTTNYLNSLRDFYFSPYFAWELNIPLIPWMILSYYSAYLAPVCGYLFLPKADHKPLVLTMMAAMAIAGFIFIIFPTKIGFTQDLTQTGIYRPLFEILWGLDYPHNLVPSLHVVIPGLLFLAINRRPLPVWFKVVIGIAVVMTFASTQFVHQHHLLDIFAALLLIGVTYKYIFLKYAQEVDMPETNNK